MCRMVLAVGDVELYSVLQDLKILAKDQNSTHELNADLGRGSWRHGDGWGVAYLQDGQWVVVKSTAALFDDPAVERLRSVKTPLAVMHARKKINGENSFENTHPFIENHPRWGECVFCHNGFVPDEITFGPQYKPRGETDSERLFYALLTGAQSAEPEEVLHDSFRRYSRVRGSNIIFVSKEFSCVGINTTILPRYYRMAMGKSKELLIVSSERLPSFSQLEWSELGPGEIVRVENKNLRMEKVPKNWKILQKLSEPRL